MEELPLMQADAGAVLGAACTLDAEDIPARIAEWAALRTRAVEVRTIPGGRSLILAADEPMAGVADLVARESECCAFYVFTVQVAGPRRELQISAGEGREAAVQALLGL